MVEYHIQQKCGIKCLRNGDYMKKLFEQIVKFGIVGAIAFVIDYAVLFVLVQFLHMDSIIAATISFTVSGSFSSPFSFPQCRQSRPVQTDPVYYFYRIKRYRSWYQRWYHVDFKRYLISVYPDLLLPCFKNRGNGDCYGMELCFKKDFP